METETLSVTSLKNEDLLAFIRRQITDFEAQKMDSKSDPDIAVFHTSFGDKANLFESSIKPVNASPETKTIRKLDRFRDQKISRLYEAFNFFEKSDEDDELEAYERLKFLFNTHKGLQDLPLDTESGAVDKFLTELEKPEYQADIAKLGLAKYITKVKTANDEFVKLYNQRSAKTSTKVLSDAKDKKKILEKEYSTFHRYINDNAVVKKTELYKTLVIIDNNLRKHYRVLMEKRKTDKPEGEKGGE